MTIPENDVRRVIELSIENRHDDAEQEMERIVRWDEDLIRRVVREEMDRATSANSDRLRRIGILSMVTGFFVGGAFPLGLSFFWYATFGAALPVMETAIASLCLGVLGGRAGWRIAK